MCRQIRLTLMFIVAYPWVASCLMTGSRAFDCGVRYADSEDRADVGPRRLERRRATNARPCLYYNYIAI